MDSEQAKAAPGVKNGAFQLLQGHPLCSRSSRRPWPGGTRGSHATAVPSPAASALFPCFRGATRTGRKAGAGHSTSVTLGAIQPAPSSPLALTIFHPMPKCFRVWPKAGKSDLMRGQGKIFRAKCWSSLTICLPQVLSECSLPKREI